MAKTIEQLKAQGAEVKNATVVGENTATRVGTLFTDIVEHVEQYEAEQTEETKANADNIAKNAQAITDEVTRAKAAEEANAAAIEAEAEKLSELVLNDNNVSNNKVTTKKSNFEIAYNGSYVDNFGEIHGNANFKIYKVKLIKADIRFVDLIQSSAGYIDMVGCIFDENGNFIKALEKPTMAMPKDASYMLLNSSTDDNEGVDDVIVSIYKNNAIYNTFVAENVSLDESCKYINNNNKTSLPNFSIVSLDINENRDYFGINIPEIVGCCYDKNNSFIGNVTKTEDGHLMFREGTTKAKLNIEKDTLYFSDRKSYKNEMNERVDFVDACVSNTKSTSREDFELVKTGYYVDNSGYYQPFSTFNVYKLSLHQRCYTINVIADSSGIGTYVGVIMSSNGSKLATLKSGFMSVPDGASYILANAEPSNNIGVFGIEQVLLKGKIMLDSTRFNETSEIEKRGQYINNGSYTTLDGFVVVKVNINKDRRYFTTESTLSIYGCCYDKDGTFLGDATSVYLNDCQEYVFAENTSYALLNVSGRNYIYSSERSTEKELYWKNHIVEKGLSYSGKKITFCGDSITDGFVSTSTGTIYDRTKSWATLLCNKLGAICDNRAVGGSCMAEGYNQYDDVLKQLKTASLSDSDYIFIAAGSNDCGEKVSSANFGNAIDSILSYIANNSNAVVFFVTPINRPAYIEEDLNKYRKIIFEKAIMGGYNYINGELFPFSSHKDSVMQKLMSDAVHPTELGYRMYARAIEMIL